MNTLVVAIFTLMFLAANGDAGEPFVRDDPAKTFQQAETVSEPPNVNNPEDKPRTKLQQEYPQSACAGKKRTALFPRTR